MEYRKIIQLGKTTHCISLPKEWLQKNQIRKGDTIIIEKKPNGLLIIPKCQENRNQTKEITIDVNKKSLEYIKRTIIAAYINDYTKIKLNGDRISTKLTEISKILQMLTAAEVMQVNKDQIIINAFLDANTVSLNNVITRLNMILSSIFIQIKNILTNEKINYEFLQRDEDVNRLCFLGFRIITSAFNNTHIAAKFGKNERGLTLAWEVIGCMERIADRLHAAGCVLRKSRGFKNISKKQKEELFNMVYKTEGAYKKSVQSYLKQDVLLAHDMVDECQSNVRLGDNMLTKHNEKYSVLFLEKLKRAGTITKHLAMGVVDQPIN